MESQQRQFKQVQQQLVDKIEFQAVRSFYPLNENLYCYFTIPFGSQCKPEEGDWIGIFKVFF
jgi:hypothetical protein